MFSVLPLSTPQKLIPEPSIITSNKMLSVLKRKASATISSPGPSASTHPTTTATNAILYPLPYGYVALTPREMITKIVEMTNSANPGVVLGNDVLCNFLPNHPSPQIVGTKRKADDDDDEEYNMLTEVEADIPHAASVGQKWKGGTNKDLFQTTMMSWTANNMANPFPDDAMVIHISNFLVKNGAMANVEIASEKVRNIHFALPYSTLLTRHRPNPNMSSLLSPGE